MREMLNESHGPTDLERLVCAGRGMAFAMPAARSAPLVIDFLNVRGLSWGSCWVAATKKMGHRIRRRSADLQGGKKGENITCSFIARGLLN